MMENQSKFDLIAYKKAKKRVADIKSFYWWVAGYIMVAVVLLYRDYAQNIFHFSRDYIVMMLILQGIFLLGVGIYLFVPALHSWEDRKINQLMKQYKKEENGK